MSEYYKGKLSKKNFIFIFQVSFDFCRIKERNKWFALLNNM